MKLTKKAIITTLISSHLLFQSVTTLLAAGNQLYCDNNEKVINTALGCISTDVKNGQFFSSLIQVGIGLGGGIALLLMLVGTIIITTSSGIPDRIKAGQKLITSAISGLIFIILSVYIMYTIGVEILEIPGL